VDNTAGEEMVSSMLLIQSVLLPYKKPFDAMNQKPIKNMPSELMSSQNDYLLFADY